MHNIRGFGIASTKEEIANLYAQTAICPICGCELKHGHNGYPEKYSPTLDRINNKTEKLTVGDLWIICHDCNATKQQFTLLEWKKYADLVCKRFDII